MKLRSGIICLVTFAALTVLLGGNLMVSDAQAQAGRSPGLRSSSVSDAHAQAQVEWIDVHFHLVADKGDLEGFDEAARAALRMMDAEKIRTIVIMSMPRPRENFDIESLAAVVKKYHPRMVMLGGGGTLNPMLQKAGQSPEVTEEVRRRFEETARGIIASGAKGFGEITAHHVSQTPNHGYESVPADHSLLLLLADIAAEYDVPIDFHFDPIPKDVEKPAHLTSPKNPAVLKENLSGLARLLAHNRKTKIVWAHAGDDRVGYFTPKLVREMLERHANLSFSIRPTSNRPGAMVPPKGPINQEWIAVLRDFPDRFVLGSDTFVVPTAGYTDQHMGESHPTIVGRRAGVQLRAIRQLLSHLPPDLARRIGYENAERLYRLNR